MARVGSQRHGGGYRKTNHVNCVPCQETQNFFPRQRPHGRSVIVCEYKAKECSFKLILSARYKFICLCAITVEEIMHYKAPRLYFENKLGGTVVTMGNNKNVYNRLGWYWNGRDR